MAAFLHDPANERTGRVAARTIVRPAPMVNCSPATSGGCDSEGER